MRKYHHMRVTVGFEQWKTGEGFSCFCIVVTEARAGPESTGGHSQGDILNCVELSEERFIHQIVSRSSVV